MPQQLKAVESATLSKKDTRYVLVDVETGEIVDDAQGYGYKSKQKAHLSWAYQHRDKSKDGEYAAKRKRIRKWLKCHSEFTNLLESCMLDIAKGSAGPDDKIDANLYRAVLKECGLEIDFTVRDLMKAYESY